MLRSTTLFGPRRRLRVGTAVAGLLLGIAAGLVVPSPASAVDSGEIEVSDSADPVNVGDTFTYTVTAKTASTDTCSLGCSTQRELTLTGSEPIAVITAVNGSGGCSITDGGLRARCAQFPIPADTIVSMTVTVQTTGSGVLTAQAHWIGDGNGFFEDFDTETTTVEGGADLSASLIDAADPAALGQTITYVQSIANGGGQAASDVIAALSLSGSSAMIVSATPSQGACTITASTVSCALGGLADSASATVTVVAEPQAIGSVTATAAVSAAETDPDTGNNTAIETTTVNNSLGCTIIGTPGDDTLTGTSGDDIICGLGGDDTINGGGSGDTIYAGTGNDIIDGGNGDDTLYGGPGDDIMGGGNGADYLYGQEGNDTNYGETLLGSLLYLFDNGADHIYGGPGNDDLDGQNGNDVLVDTEGTDTMSGGLGNDTINVQDGTGGDTANGGLGNDTCTTDPGDTTTSC